VPGSEPSGAVAPPPRRSKLANDLDVLLRHRRPSIPRIRKGGRSACHEARARTAIWLVAKNNENLEDQPRQAA
jgi:hypothetical protein